MTFVIHQSEQDTVINGVLTHLITKTIWFEEEDREATDRDIEHAFFTCDGIGYHVMRRLDGPVDPVAFDFGMVTRITLDNAVEITSLVHQGQRQVLSPHSFHERYEID